MQRPAFLWRRAAGSLMGAVAGCAGQVPALRGVRLFYLAI